MTLRHQPPWAEKKHVRLQCKNEIDTNLKFLICLTACNASHVFEDGENGSVEKTNVKRGTCCILPKSTFKSHRWFVINGGQTDRGYTC